MLLLWTVALRWRLLGNPLIYNDEDFYLYIGGQLLKGHLPYVSVWDRKPFGLFALYAFFHLFGSWRFWAYQLGAVMAVWGTALLIKNMAQSLTKHVWGAAFGGFLYVAALNMYVGYGGQAPVYYNFLMALAFWLLVRQWPDAPATKGKLRQMGMASMGLVGLALTLKPTVVFEGVYLGLGFILLGLHNHLKWRTLLSDSVIWVLCALMPTLLIIGGYALSGHGHEWWFANVESIFQRHAELEPHNLKRFLRLVLIMAAVWPLAWAFHIRFTAIQKSRFALISGWALAAVVAVVVVGGFYNHYNLPLLLPFCVLLPVLFDNRITTLSVAVLGIYMTVAGEAKVIRQDRFANRHDYDAMVKVLSQPEGCVFEYDANPILLDATPTAANCQLTRWPFPAHLGLPREQGALGVTPNEYREVVRVLSQHPRYIVTDDFTEMGADNQPIMPQDRHLLDVINRDYEFAYGHRLKDRYNVIIWRLKSGLQPHTHP
ncbi:hypothetical protein E3E12_04095 [Formicincola oecophyllae]|uniref:Glycosyltransferase RgtA/B/C/D-like domain-containing protein n=1 Tax=Formicincola oecophyllae TaxID=2558361 RepID=A0A4Y6U834_9PROT|nr:hypothetical protein [Formicincola oecophyllae]QDH13512.1 hypothetical protein E3E12_04095 [Formicincola oecophyllae]